MFPVPEPPLLSLLEPPPPSPGQPDALRVFLEKLVEAAAKHGGLVVGEAEPGRYVLVMPPLGTDALKAQIDAGLDLVLGRLGKRWRDPRVTDFGLRELYARTRDKWLAPRGMESLVAEGKVGVVTIFCHDWVYALAAQVAHEHGLRVETSLEEYLKAGRIQVAGRTTFQIDVFANLQEMAANFLPIDHVIAKLLVIAELSRDESLSKRVASVTGSACRACGAFLAAEAKSCASCGAPVP